MAPKPDTHKFKYRFCPRCIHMLTLKDGVWIHYLDATVLHCICECNKIISEMYHQTLTSAKELNAVPSDYEFPDIPRQEFK